MAKQVSVLSVFVASPDDVSEEREALEQVIRELNHLWSMSKSIRLELIRWETHAYPSVGVDAQAVINEQIGDSYDIFIGILWKKFGTPTGRACSGTEEEFNRAYERYKENPSKLRIMFYFKTAPPADLNEVDPRQWSLVARFREQLGTRGSLYWNYRGKEEFSSLLRLHLTRHTEDWGSKWDVPEVAKAEPPTPPPSVQHIEPAAQPLTIIDEEEGFIDLIETGNESLESLHSLTERMAASIQTLGERICQRTRELEAAKVSPGSPDLKAIKRICNHAAEDLDNFSQVMEKEVPIFAERFRKGVDAHARAAPLTLDFASQGEDVRAPLSGAHEAVKDLYGVMQGSTTTIRRFRHSIASSPRMTTQYNRSKRRALIAVDRFIADLDSALSQLDEARKTYEFLIEAAGAREDAGT